MKKLLIFILFLLFVWATPAMAFLGDIDIDENTNINKNTNLNANLNANKNINKNTNIQGQFQGQMQGQMQSQGQLQGQTAHNEGVKQKVVFIEAENKRELMKAPEMLVAPLGDWKELKKSGPEFIPLKKLTMFKDTFSFEHALEVYGKKYGKGKCITNGGSYKGRHEDDPTPEIKVLWEVDKDKVEFAGTITVQTNPKKKNVTSYDVLQKAVLSAALMKGDILFPIDEGFENLTENSGWGLGFNGSEGMISEDGDRAKTGSASQGMGYSRGKAWNRTLPWIQFHVLKYK